MSMSQPGEFDVIPFADLMDRMQFTGAEVSALMLSGELASLLYKICGDGPSAVSDWNEFALHLHAIQRAIGAQIGARLFPALLRPLGGDTLPSKP